MSDGQMSFAEVFPVKNSARHQEGAGRQQTSGQSSQGSSPKSDLGSSSPKMCKSYPLGVPALGFNPSDIAPLKSVLGRMMLGQTIREIAGGPLHTPTTKANFTAPSMQKWPSCRRYVEIFGDGPITPEQFEFLMGYPIGWTALEPLEMP